MNATAFFSHVSGGCYRVKMERQEKYRQEQQHADHADTPGSTGSGRKCSHHALNTQVCLLCKALESDANPARLPKQKRGRHHKVLEINSAFLIQ
jgi:hypothetical protein